MDRNERDLRDARREWQDAIETARRNRKGLEDGEGPEQMEGPDAMIAKARKALAGMGNILASQAGKIGAQGTFMAGNVLGLQAGGVMDRVAIGIDKIERNTRPIRDAEGLAFE